MNSSVSHFITAVLSAALLVSACGKNERSIRRATPGSTPDERPLLAGTLPSPTKERPLLRGDMEDHFPISQGTPEERSWGKAVAMIRTPTSTGSGFFISDDGLLLTNSHVIGYKSCSFEYCGGIQVIRDFHEDGDAEIFNRVRLLFEAPFNEGNRLGADLAILKVDLPPGQKVPYLDVATDEETVLNIDTLSILGHTFGGPLRISRGLPLTLNNGYFSLRTMIAMGNSGGPIIDSRSKKVVGLLNAVDKTYRIDEILKNGFYPGQTSFAPTLHLGQKHVSAIFPNLRLGKLSADEFLKKVSVKVARLEKKTRANDLEQMLPAPRSFFTRHLITGDRTLFQQFYGTSHGAKELEWQLSVYLAHIEQKESAVALAFLLRSLILNDLGRGAVTQVPEKIINAIAHVRFPEENNDYPASLRGIGPRFIAHQTRKDTDRRLCFRTMLGSNAPTGTIADLLAAGRCGYDLKKTPIVRSLYETLRATPELTNELSEQVYGILNEYTSFKTISNEELKLISEMLSRIAPRIDRWSTYNMADTLRVRALKTPHQIHFKAFENCFTPPEKESPWSFPDIQSMSLDPIKMIRKFFELKEPS